MEPRSELERAAQAKRAGRAHGTRCRYTSAASLQGRRKLGSHEYGEALRPGTLLRRVCTPARNSGQTGTGRRPRGTRLPPVRGQAANSPLMCTGGHAPPVHVWQKRTGSRKLGRDVYPARYTSAASLHGPVKLGRDVYGRVDSGLTCTGGRRPNALLTESAMGAKPAIIRQGRVYAFAQVRPRVVACQFDVIPH